MAPKSKRKSTPNEAKTYRMSPSGIAAIEQLCIALDLPRGRVMELAAIRLQDDWRSGKVRLGLVPIDSLQKSANGENGTHSAHVPQARKSKRSKSA